MEPRIGLGQELVCRDMTGPLQLAYEHHTIVVPPEVAAAVREGLGLAQHVATLLGLDDRGEASDVVSRYVAPDELPEVLALRRWPGEPEEVAPPPPPEEDAELALMMP